MACSGAPNVYRFVLETFLVFSIEGEEKLTNIYQVVSAVIYFSWFLPSFRFPLTDVLDESRQLICKM
jgi:hypothetical protein